MQFFGVFKSVECCLEKIPLQPQCCGGWADGLTTLRLLIILLSSNQIIDWEASYSLVSDKLSPCLLIYCFSLWDEKVITLKGGLILSQDWRLKFFSCDSVPLGDQLTLPHREHSIATQAEDHKTYTTYTLKNFRRHFFLPRVRGDIF